MIRVRGRLDGPKGIPGVLPTDPILGVLLGAKHVQREGDPSQRRELVDHFRRPQRPGGDVLILRSGFRMRMGTRAACLGFLSGIDEVALDWHRKEAHRVVLAALETGLTCDTGSVQDAGLWKRGGPHCSWNARISLLRSTGPPSFLATTGVSGHRRRGAPNLAEDVAPFDFVGGDVLHLEHVPAFSRQQGTSYEMDPYRTRGGTV